MSLAAPNRPGSVRTIFYGFVAVGLLLAGLYLMSLLLAPTISLSVRGSVDESALPTPAATQPRVFIPKIGVDVVYGKGQAALDSGAEWRHPASGNPRDGGNFVIAAHRYSIQPTPQSTIEKSPFFNIDRLGKGDRILVDFEGTRYAYQVVDKFDVTPDRGDIEARTEQPRLTLYSCELEGADHGRVALIGEPVKES